MKLNIIFDSKCKINTKWRKIKMKTRNLTQSSLQNDPINRPMHGFSFPVFEDKIEVQDVISPLYLDQILISSIPSTQKRVKNMKKSNWHLNWCQDSSNFSKVQGRVFLLRRSRYLKEKLGLTVRWRGASRSTVSMKCRLIETVRLSRIRPINDQRLRWVHVF